MKRNVFLIVCTALAVGACEDEVSISELPRMRAVAIGDAHSCALSETGQAYCWGDGTDGQLGSGRVERRRFAVPVNTDVEFRIIDAGARHTCALSTDAIAYCWGANAAGQLGLGSSESQLQPQAVTATDRFVTISTGEAHTCAISTDGRAWCWGRGSNGELGNGALAEMVTAPAVVSGALHFVQISAGSRHTCAIATDGAAYCWGANDVSQLGIGVIGGPPHPAPARVDAGLAFRAISAGDNHTCAITADFVAYCWGENRAGETGNGWVWHPGEPAEIRPVPITDYGSLRLTSISAGAAYSCGTRANGEVYCWGRGENGQLGTGTLSSFIVPQIVRPVPSGLNTDLYAAIDATGRTHTCGLKFSGAVFCWGQGGAGQLGNGEYISKTPAQVLRAR